MERFSKIFKNTTVVYRDSKVEFIYRVGLSVRVNYESSILEVYREEGKVLGDKSSSRGKTFKIRFKGTPTVEGLCKFLSLKLEGSRFTFFTTSEIFLRSGKFAVFTQDVRLTEFFLDLASGKVFKEERGKDPEQIGYLRPVDRLEDLLELSADLWSLVDRHGINH